MGKKYYPSGYQILEINPTDISSGSNLTKTDDVKTLIEIIEKGQLGKKPILIHDLDAKYVMFANVDIVGKTVQYSHIEYDMDFEIAAGYYVSLYYYDGEIQVTKCEL